jgi:hypothetical protein
MVNMVKVLSIYNIDIYDMVKVKKDMVNAW